eukprot:169645-Lingulodinium_polyedra.AAC.1
MAAAGRCVCSRARRPVAEATRTRVFAFGLDDRRIGLRRRAGRGALEDPLRWEHVLIYYIGGDVYHERVDLWSFVQGRR